MHIVRDDHSLRGRRALGLRLAPRADGPGPSVLASLDAEGALTGLDVLAGDEAVAAALAGPPALVVVDQPLVIANERGQRDLERLLSWCDAPTLPISRARLAALFGGARGEAVAALAPPSAALAECPPDLVLRVLAWEALHAPAADLAEFRERWLGLRAPRYRPPAVGTGRGRPEGLLPAWRLLAGVVDMGGWSPAGADERAVAADAARLDAIACAHAAWRAVTGRAGFVVARSGDGAVAVLPAGAHLAERLEVNAERLRAGPPRTPA